MGPEMFFRPEIIDSKWSTSLVQMLDNTIQMSPVDCRRSLYKNIILSGGSTSVRNLHSRLEKELKETVATRMEKYAQGKGTKPAPIEINIYSSPYQNYAVWNGGSMLACHVIY
jgi:actin-related protein 3